MARIICLAWLALALWAQASVTAGWKVPSSQVVYSLGDDPNVPKLEKPPGESAFFEPGDELWDISGVVSHRILRIVSDRVSMEGGMFGLIHSWPGEWVVWNARSGMVVARGAESDLMQVQEAMEFLKVPVEVRAKLELISGSDKEPRAISLLCASGMKAVAEAGDLALEIEPTAGMEEGKIRVLLDTTARAGDSSWNFASDLVLSDGRRTKIAHRSSDSPEMAWELFLTLSRESPEGTLISELRWKETAAEVEAWPWADRLRVSVREPFSKFLQLSTLQVSADFLDGLGRGKNPEGIPRIEAPPELSRWVKGKSFDLTSIFRENGLELAKEAKVIFDPGWQRVLVLASPEELRVIEELFGSGLYTDSSISGRRELPPCSWIEVSHPSGSWGVACSSGCRAALIGQGGAGELSFEIEPTFGGDNLIADLRYSFKLATKAGGAGALTSATLVHLGVPQEVGSFMLPTGQEEKVAITVTSKAP